MIALFAMRAMRHPPLIALGLFMLCIARANVLAGDHIEFIHFPSGVGTLNLGMRHLAASHASKSSTVLILHGATFPSGNAAAWKFEGRSWMDQLAELGYDVYGAHRSW
jgi:hypothetical protein